MSQEGGHISKVILRNPLTLQSTHTQNYLKFRKNM